MVSRFATVFISLIAVILLSVSSRVIDKCSDCQSQNQKAVSYPEMLCDDDKKFEWDSKKVTNSFEYPKKIEKIIKKVKRSAEEPPGSSGTEPVSDSSSPTSSESPLLTSITPNSTSRNSNTTILSTKLSTVATVTPGTKTEPLAPTVTTSENTTDGLTTGTKETPKISTEEFVSIMASSEAVTKVSDSVSAAKNTTETPTDAATTPKTNTDEFTSVAASSEAITKAPDSTVKNETETSIHATATPKNTNPALNEITTNTVLEVYTAGITTIASEPPNVTTTESFPTTESSSQGATTLHSSKGSSKSRMHWYNTTSNIVPTTMLLTITPKIIAADTNSTATISARETTEADKTLPETTTADFVDSEEYDELDELLNGILTNQQELDELEKNLQEISDLLTCIIHQFLRGISGGSGSLKNCLNSTDIFNSSNSTQEIINGLIRFISDDSDLDFLL